MTDKILSAEPVRYREIFGEKLTKEQIRAMHNSPILKMALEKEQEILDLSLHNEIKIPIPDKSEGFSPKNKP